MTELKIDRQQLLKLRSESHALNPMVLLGQNGLTDAVLKEIGKALDSHGLVKIRIPGDDREERDADIERILNEMGAARIQTIGKTVTIWRPMLRRKTPARCPPRIRRKTVREAAAARFSVPTRSGSRSARHRSAALIRSASVR